MRSPYMLNWARLTLESELQKRLKHPVTIDKISGDVFTGLNIKGIEVADSSPENPPLISLSEIQLRYRLWSLAQGKFLITQLHLKQPQVNARMQPDGVLNLAELIPKGEQEAGAKFPVQLLISDVNVEDINIENGAINIEDESSSLQGCNRRNLQSQSC